MTAGCDRAGGSGSIPTGVLEATSTLPDSDYPGLKAFADFRLKGVLIYCESVLLFESGTQPAARLRREKTMG